MGINSAFSPFVASLRQQLSTTWRSRETKLLKETYPRKSRRVERTRLLSVQATHAPSRCEPRSRATARRAAH
jgi:hypothetical protein